MLTSAKNCKKVHIFDNLRTITQEGDMKTRLITPIFYLLFELQLLRNLTCRCKLWDQNFVSFGSGNIHTKESKTPGFIFSIELRIKFVYLMVYFCLFWNANLQRVEARVCNFETIFLRLQFSLVATFFFYFWLSVWVEICILNFLMSFLHLYH